MSLITVQQHGDNLVPRDFPRAVESDVNLTPFTGVVETGAERLQPHVRPLRDPYHYPSLCHVPTHPFKRSARLRCQCIH